MLNPCTCFHVGSAYLMHGSHCGSPVAVLHNQYSEYPYLIARVVSVNNSIFQYHLHELALAMFQSDWREIDCCIEIDLFGNRSFQ